MLEFELLLVEKIVLRWGGEPVPAFEKSETVCKEYILFFYVRIFVFFFPFSTYFTDLHNGCTYTERSVFSFTSLPPLCKVSIFKSGSPCQDFKSCMYFLLQNNSYKYKLESNN